MAVFYIFGQPLELSEDLVHKVELDLTAEVITVHCIKEDTGEEFISKFKSDSCKPLNLIQQYIDLVKDLGGVEDDTFKGKLEYIPK